MRRRKKKSSLNWAVCLMVITTICLCSIQYGYSFFNQGIDFSGTAIISGQVSGNTAQDIVANANSGNANFVQSNSFTGATATVANGLGFDSIFQAEKGAIVNNYLVFSSNATEYWRIVGFTEYGVKIVKATRERTPSDVSWDNNNRSWVELPTEVSITEEQAQAGEAINTKQSVNLSNASSSASVIFQYLNTGYGEHDSYLSILTSPTLNGTTNVNYINPNYINTSAYWDITPMRIDGLTLYYPEGVKPNSIMVNGFALGLLSAVEINLLSNSFNDGTGTDVTHHNSGNYSAVFSGWISDTTAGIDSNFNFEMLITDHARSDTITTTAYETNQGVFLQDYDYANSGKSSAGRWFRPAMYLKSNIILSLKNGENSADGGSMSNPFVVTGIGA